MRIAYALISAALLVGCQTMQSPQSKRSEVMAATQAWIAAMSSHDAQRVVALYKP